MKLEYYNSKESDFEYCPAYEGRAAGIYRLSVKGTDRELSNACWQICTHRELCPLCKIKDIRCIRLYAIIGGNTIPLPRGKLNQQPTSDRIFNHIENCPKCEEMLKSLDKFRKTDAFVREIET